MNKSGVIYIHGGNSVNVVRMSPETAKDNLPPKVYSVQFSEMSGFYLNIVKDSFAVPSVVFGSASKRADKVLSTFNSREKATGVLMTGNKGSGKTMLAEMIANKALEEGMPVILVNGQYVGDSFNNFISDLGECCFIFDEFAKTYDEEQFQLLTLLDGTMSERRLVILTENNKYDIDDFLMNRPGRLLYHFEYDRLEHDVIIEFCQYHKLHADITNNVIEESNEIISFNMDMLKSIIEEYIRYGDSIKEIIGELNISTAKPLSYLKFKSLKHHKYGDIHSISKPDQKFKEGEYIEIKGKPSDSLPKATGASNTIGQSSSDSDHFYSCFYPENGFMYDDGLFVKFNNNEGDELTLQRVSNYKRAF